MLALNGSCGQFNRRKTHTMRVVETPKPDPFGSWLRFTGEELELCALSASRSAATRKDWRRLDAPGQLGAVRSEKTRA